MAAAPKNRSSSESPGFLHRTQAGPGAATAGAGAVAADAPAASTDSAPGAGRSEALTAPRLREHSSWSPSAPAARDASWSSSPPDTREELSLIHI
eukprot:9160245-Alexandrium_andersonii.AAC.1